MEPGPGWDFDRASRVWRVRETDFYIFHIEPNLCEDAELQSVLAGADERYLRIGRALGHDPCSIKERERLLKTNYWIYPGSVLKEAAEKAGYKSIACGTASPSGVQFAQMNMSWRDLIDQMTHEEIHLLWAREVGEAPSLLNEGIAVYFERVLSARSDERMEELREAWLGTSRDESGFLRRLSRNAEFWEAHSQGKRVYEVGGALTGHLVEVHGLSLVKEIFRASHYEDDNLASLLERGTGLRLEQIEARLGEWCQRHQIGNVGVGSRG